MTKHALLSLAIISACTASLAQAKPMDNRYADYIPELRRIATLVRKGDSIPKESTFLEKCIDTKDPVLLSVVAWISGEAAGIDDTLRNKLDNIPKSKLGEMEKAFIQIAIEKHSTRLREGRWLPSQSLRSSGNPYLRIETARILLRENPPEGQAVVRSLLGDKSSFVRAVAQGLETNKDRSSDRALLIDERYELVVSIIEGD